MECTIASLLLQLAKAVLKFRAATITLLYRKSLRVNLATLAKFSMGEVANFMSTDTDRISNYANSFHEFWSLPLQIVVALVLLYQQVRCVQTDSHSLATSHLCVRVCLHLRMYNCSSHLPSPPLPHVSGRPVFPGWSSNCHPPHSCQPMAGQEDWQAHRRHDGPQGLQSQGMQLREGGPPLPPIFLLFIRPLSLTGLCMQFS